MKTKKIILLVLFLLGVVHAQSQDLLKELESVDKDSVYALESTFMATRLSIGHSVVTRKKNVLEISAMTRYWNIPQESSNSFVADRMSARFGVDYGISDRLTIAAGYSTQNSIVDGFLKYGLVYQKNHGSIVSLTLLQTATHRNLEGAPANSYAGTTSNDLGFLDELAFTSQVLIARKFSRHFSLQITPTYIHRNTSILNGDIDQYAVGIGGRYKVANHVSVVSEYYYLLNPIEDPETYGPFSLGVNWEVGDLMLQFKMTNNGAFVEDTFIPNSRNNFNFRDGNFYFGFHATYFIQL
jgi:hypothetical protein